MSHHLAEFNLAGMKAPLDDPRMAGFVARLEPLNALADRSPGFVWRLQTEEGNSTAIRAFPDPQLLVNLSVWESLEALRAYVYDSEHIRVIQDSAKWFDPAAGPSLVLWWIPAGELPSLDEAKRRLDLLRGSGPCRDAFTFAAPFSTPEQATPEQADQTSTTPA